jgi:hypothetical protein
VGLTILVSAAATLAGAVKTDSRIVGGLAAVPGILTLGASTLRLNERAAWFFMRKEMISGLRRRLLYELPVDATADNVAAISKSWTDKDHDLHELFKKFLSDEAPAMKKIIRPKP